MTDMSEDVMTTSGYGAENTWKIGVGYSPVGSEVTFRMRRIKSLIICSNRVKTEWYNLPHATAARILSDGSKINVR